MMQHLFSGWIGVLLMRLINGHSATSFALLVCILVWELGGTTTEVIGLNGSN